MTPRKNPPTKNSTLLKMMKSLLVDSKDTVITIPLPMMFSELLIHYISKLINLFLSVLPQKVILKQLSNLEILLGVVIKMISVTLMIIEKMPKMINLKPKMLNSLNSFHPSEKNLLPIVWLLKENKEVFYVYMHPKDNHHLEKHY